MPTGIAASDRKVLLIGGGVLILMLTTSVILAPPAEDSLNSLVPSTYSAGSGGAEAAYRLLTALHYPVRRWEAPPTELEAHSENLLLILAEPNQPPSAGERKALGDFVQKGGHVLFTGASIQSYFPDASISSKQTHARKSFTPNIPSALTRGVQHISIMPQAYWNQLSGSQLSIYGDTKSPAVVSWLLGDGEIVWWAGSTPLSNAGISRDDNLIFFLNSVRNWSRNKPYRIIWDEYFHGRRSSLWSYIAKTSLVWGLLQVAVLAAAVVFTFSRRKGPICVPSEISRLSPLEFVDTLGGLYNRAGATSSVVSVSYLQLRSLLTRQLGLASNTPNIELAAAAEQRLGWKESGLGESLRRAASANQDAKIRAREALELVQNLEKFAAKLNLRSQREKS